jgi:hypothetical protein
MTPVNTGWNTWQLNATDIATLRQRTICPLCNQPKQAGLLTCWSCYHSWKLNQPQLTRLLKAVAQTLQPQAATEQESPAKPRQDATASVTAGHVPPAGDTPDAATLNYRAVRGPEFDAVLRALLDEAKQLPDLITEASIEYPGYLSLTDHCGRVLANGYWEADVWPSGEACADGEQPAESDRLQGETPVQLLNDALRITDRVPSEARS